MRRSFVRGLLVLVLAACSSSTSDEAIVFDLRATDRATKTFEAPRSVQVIADGQLVEAFIDRDGDGSGDGDGEPVWHAPQLVDELHVDGDGAVTMTVWARGAPVPMANRDRSLAWFDPVLLDDASVISFAKIMAAIASDNHGGVLLENWFRAFAAGPGAGRATFAQFLDEVIGTQGANASAWNLGVLPFKVTGIHNRVDLASGDDCGELRVSVASTHATFSPVHLIFLFRQEARDDDVRPDGVVHCRGTARAWARLSGLDAAAFRDEAKRIVADAFTRAKFLLAESVELSLSPWQWRQWTFDASGGVANPPLFQTIDIARVNAPGPTRDAFLAAVSANSDAIMQRTWAVPAMFRSAVAEVQPNSVAPLVNVPSAEQARALSMIGCPRCHTDDADFIQTGADRKPSPFYDRELDARAARLDALGRGESPPAPPFGPLQPL